MSIRRPVLKEENSDRFNVTIESELNSYLKKTIPWGSKNDVVRELLHMLKEAVDDSGNAGHFVADLLDGQMKIVHDTSGSDEEH